MYRSQGRNPIECHSKIFIWVVSILYRIQTVISSTERIHYVTCRNIGMLMEILFMRSQKYIFTIALKLFLRSHHFKYMTYKQIHINFHVFYWQEFHLCVLLKSDSGWGNKTNWLYQRNFNEILAFPSQNLLQFRWIVYNILLLQNIND